MLRILYALVLLLALSPVAQAAVSGQIQAARTFLHNGNPEQAVVTARRALKKPALSASERLELLSTIAKAETMRVTHQHFQQVEPAIAALEAVINEFPDAPDAPEFRWQQAWLWWQAGEHKQAISAAREIIAQDQQPHYLRRAWLLMARVHLQMNNSAYARSDLLQYGLQVESGSREQAIGMAWMAMVDRRESRLDVAFKTLNAVYRNWPQVIRDEAQLFATYIELLHHNGKDKLALQLANVFVRQYSDLSHSAMVRLIRADIHAADPRTIDDAIKEYTILADRRAETTIGRKAFMRKLMLEFRDETRRDRLLPVLMSLKKLADANQLSPIEDEAMLDLARLWARITPLDARLAQAKVDVAPALEAYARAGASLDSHIADAARAEGAQWLQKYIMVLLQQRQWLKAVTIWCHYPQLRPEARKSQVLRLGIARAMRMLMLFDSAEVMLEQLYAENRRSIRGQRIMMERARLWLDRRDADGVRKIMRWLNRHEFSIYRPELLLIVARMQLTAGQADLARQTLISVAAEDLAPESRLHYWQATAETAEALSQYHQAARAWSEYRKTAGADAGRGLTRQSEALFRAGEFARARELYRQMPEAQRDAGWQYHMGIGQLRSGELKQGVERLRKLIDRSDGGRFAALARLALADLQAQKLLGMQP